MQSNSGRRLTRVMNRAGIGTMLGWSILALACAGQPPMVSGEFGQVAAPNQYEIAEVHLKSGEVILAKKLQTESDTLFAVLVSFDIRSIPLNSIANIKIKKDGGNRPGGMQTALEKPQPDSAGVYNPNTAKDAEFHGALIYLVYLGVLVTALFAAIVVAGLSG